MDRQKIEQQVQQLRSIHPALQGQYGFSKSLFWMWTVTGLLVLPIPIFSAAPQDRLIVTIVALLFYTAIAYFLWSAMKTIALSNEVLYKTTPRTGRARFCKIAMPARGGGMLASLEFDSNLSSAIKEQEQRVYYFATGQGPRDGDELEVSCFFDERDKLVAIISGDTFYAVPVEESSKKADSQNSPK